MRSAPSIELSPRERADLRRWSLDPTPSARLGGRAKIVLEAAEGRSNTEIALDVGVHPGTVARWRTRFLVGRVDGLRREAPRAGHSTRVPNELVEQILRKTLHEQSPDGGPWTTRSLARSLRVNHMMVHRVWTAYRLARSSPDLPSGTTARLPLVELAGVYLSRSAGAVVFAVGPRRTGRVAPDALPAISPNITGREEFDDPHEAAADLAGMLRRFEETSPRNGERPAPAPLLVFLRTVEQRAPRTARLEVVLDHPLATHDRRIQDWLAVHARFHVFTTPAGEPWDRTVETWLSRWGGSRFHHDSLRAVPECVTTLGDPKVASPAGGPYRAWINRRAGIRTRRRPSPG